MPARRAGLGRAPAVALAYMWWVKGMPLNEAFEHLRSLRPCSPKLFAIRQARRAATGTQMCPLRPLCLL